jgi:XisI protein
MDKIAFLQNSITSAMSEYADYLAGSNLPKVDYSLLTDDIHKRYQLLAVGWEKNERIYSVVFHADIINDHVWIQEDNTEDGFANLLLEKGVDKKDVVLAYYPDYHRQYTEFAVA